MNRKNHLTFLLIQKNQPDVQQKRKCYKPNTMYTIKVPKERDTLVCIQSIIDALVQVVIFTITPFLYWAITFRKSESFARWIGLKKVVFNNKKKALILSVLSFVMLLLSGIILLSVIDDKTMIANAQFSSMGMQSILLI